MAVGAGVASASGSAATSWSAAARSRVRSGLSSAGAFGTFSPSARASASSVRRRIGSSEAVKAAPAELELAPDEKFAEQPKRGVVA